MEEHIHQEYYESGAIKTIIPYINGKIHGIIQDYHPNGNIAGESAVKYGRAHGIWRSYSGLGKLNFEMKFWNGWLLREVRLYNHKNGSSTFLEEFSTRFVVSKEIHKSLKHLKCKTNLKPYQD